MIKKYFIFILILLGGCGTENPITEVGNPTRLSAADSTISALSNSIVAMFSADAMYRAGYTCSYNSSQKCETCTCPKGGTFTHCFQDQFSENEDSFTFSSTTTLTFENCITDTCAGEAKMHGQGTGTMSGTYNRVQNTRNFQGTFTTASACEGMTVNDAPLGFSMTISVQGSEGSETRNVSGTLCNNNDSLTFTSLDDLKNQVDPHGTCTNLFKFEENH